MLEPIWGDLAIPFMLLLAWLAGELGYRWLSIPRVSSYGVVGVLIAALTNVGRNFFEVEDLWSLTILAQIGFGLILFELGYRTNLGWLRRNLWLSITCLLECCATFAAVLFLAQWFGLTLVPALLLASLSMATSPMTLLPVINELRSSGQVTERTLHLSAINCAFAIIAFNGVVGYWVLQSAGNTFDAVWSSLVVVFVSAGLGMLFGVVLPRLLRLADATDRHTTVAFALAVAALILVTHSLHFSPVLATLVFGMTARHYRTVRHQGQPNFGVLGDLLVIVLFVHLGSRLHLDALTHGALLAAGIMIARFLAKALSILALSRLSGLSLKKGMLTSIAVTPLAAFSILLLELAAQRGLNFPDTLAMMSGLLLLVDIACPFALRASLLWAGEAQAGKEA